MDKINSMKDLKMNPKDKSLIITKSNVTIEFEYSYA